MLRKSRTNYLSKGTREVASKPKIVAEWESEEGTRFLVRTRFERAEEGRQKERYDTKEVTPDVVEGTGALKSCVNFNRRGQTNGRSTMRIPSKIGKRRSWWR